VAFGNPGFGNFWVLLKKSKLIPLPELKKFLVCTNTSQLEFVVSQ
jgi:hypothetical protein